MMPELASIKAEPNSLPRILEQKLAAFKEFLSATVVLKQHLLADDIKQIDTAIDRRQVLMRYIDNLDNRLKSMTRHSGTDQQIEVLSTALEEAITKVITLNGECAAITASRRDELEKELTGISNERLALQGYAGGQRHNGNNRTPRFLNVNA
ncbi:MAG: hypothetical protein IH629_07180 [Thermoleophilia bacterium]|nr:hypothetical protein [Thermoleophilia bacterium]